MRIENEMLLRLETSKSLENEMTQMSLSNELDFFFNNVMDTVVEYFQEKQEILI